MIEWKRVQINDVDSGEIGRLTVARFLAPPRTEEAWLDLFRLIQERAPKKLTLNLAGIDCLPCRAVGKLIYLNETVKAYGGAMRLSHVSPSVHETLLAFQLQRVLDIDRDTSRPQGKAEDGITLSVVAGE